jgi:hypothetical protein
MPDAQPSSSNPHAAPGYTEREILWALTNPFNNQPVWSLEDLGRELGDQIAVADAVAMLHTADLIHCTADGFVLASRATVCLLGIVGCIV